MREDVPACPPAAERSTISTFKPSEAHRLRGHARRPAPAITRSYLSLFGFVCNCRRLPAHVRGRVIKELPSIATAGQPQSLGMNGGHAPAPVPIDKLEWDSIGSKKERISGNPCRTSSKDEPRDDGTWLRIFAPA